jgi:hypothetical protein
MVWAKFMWLIIGTGATLHAFMPHWGIILFVVTEIFMLFTIWFMGRVAQSV